MKILVTGAAGFIGFHVAQKLLKHGHELVGLDNLNPYYDVDLKYSRLSQLGIDKSESAIFDTLCTSKTYGTRFQFIRMNLENREKLPELFKEIGFESVCSMAAQAGVRYSIEQPEPYVDTNVVGFLNVLESCRNFKVSHLVYASSSSVYGLNEQIPYSLDQKLDKPVSLYAATKISNELMAHAYSNLFGFRTTGLRFFTVYGPWGRPDMAIYLFTNAILNNKPIKVFNNGNMERDFTYIDDIVEGVIQVLEKEGNEKLHNVYNIGAGNPVKLMDFITEISKTLNTEPQLQLLPMQKGDMERTWADISQLKNDYGYEPKTHIKEGIGNFVDWYRDYYSKQQTK
ncbi:MULTISPECIES: NAD-dependent epimerase/dehydratase family protein [Flavobacteriaceae]|uniref:NAD-dependent epimerase/dehydratase family protein n=1 Tax=Flavobacteriaceae TaxID=49546 RepID=UPI001492691D|nr:MULTISPECIES: NAD-dependent epimerase/dehydratase family protein [Allomuricauda]MDC6366858.1 NAD-dependent epimerase/dehydratase family protein [Muricauda sp. AC10]